MNRPSGQDRHAHLDGLGVTFEFDRTLSKREWEAISHNREWLLGHISVLDQLSERNREIVTLRFGLDDDVVRSIDVVASGFELTEYGVKDVIDNSIVDLRRIVGE